MFYILTDRRVWEDYKPIADLGTLIKYNKGWGSPVFKPDDTVFAFSTIPCPKGGIRINSDMAIVLANNKPKSRLILGINNVPIPKTWFDYREAEIPFVARPKRHTLGINFYTIRNSADLRKNVRFFKDGWYYSELFPTEKEYRVIVWGDEVITSFRKPLKGSVEETVAWRKRNQMARSNPVFEDISQEDKELCIKAIKAIGLDFGGVDLMISKEHSVICEVNSAPIIRPILVEPLRERLWRLI
jgi:glutathione synthase/RimK-type ligase-like ATP-grasp enzyme